MNLNKKNMKLQTWWLQNNFIEHLPKHEIDLQIEGMVYLLIVG